MQQPCLKIIAGCNGSGKSTYSKLFSEDPPSFDYDKRFLLRYNLMPDSELREQIAIDSTTNEFNTEFNEAIENKKSFCFETNLTSPYPSEKIEQAKINGYRLEMYFFCLESIELAKKRVDIRTKNDGHFVEDHVIRYKWKEGYKNINLHYTDFDYLLFVDNSTNLKIPKPLFEMEKSGENTFVLRKYSEELPKYTQRRLPEIFNLLIE